MSFPMHVGQIIKDVLDQKMMTYSKVAEDMGMSAQNLHSVFKRKSTDLGFLMKLGDLVEYDFISRLAREVNPEFEGSKKEEKQLSPPIQKISVMVDLDGTDTRLNYWINRLASINSIVG